jgi:serine-type D-Ala-D-Ala carboxypeptidase/endopeptidase (penicillin-binding protein 4)
MTAAPGAVPHARSRQPIRGDAAAVRRLVLALLVGLSLLLAACAPNAAPGEASATGQVDTDGSGAEADGIPAPGSGSGDAAPALPDPASADDQVADRAAPEPSEDGAHDAASVPDEGTSTVLAPTTSRLPEPPPSRARIEAEAASLLAGLLERRDGEQVSVLVVDQHGREVVAHDPDVPVLPASTLKIVTAAAALVTFGPEARFTTRIETTAPIDGDGVVRGDLVLIGTGDPVLATPEYGRWIYPARPRTPFEDLAAQVAAAGITEVAGDVVGVVERFEGPLIASGWPDRYFNDFDARFADGLSVDAGVRTIVTYPEVEDEEGDEDDQDTSGTPVREDGEEGEDAEPTGPPIVRIEHTRSPAEHAVNELIRLLGEHDIEVTGQGRVGAPVAASVGRLATVTSPPLEEILRFAVQRSDNQITDAVFRAVGRQRTGVGSFASGERALKQVLERLGIATEGTVFADGSGLSRDDRATARLLVELDRVMHASRHAPTWTSLMAVMGESGTLQSRLANTVAAGRFVGKTGTLRDVTALTGAVVGEDGRRYHLAVIANADGQARWLSRTFVDEVIVLLSADVRGCEVLAASGGEGALGRPPVAVRC